MGKLRCIGVKQSSVCGGCGVAAVVKLFKGEALGPLVQLINIRGFPFLLPLLLSLAEA